MTLGQLADELLEIRRCVRSHPDEMYERTAALDGAFYVIFDRRGNRFEGERFRTNLFNGCLRRRSNPEVLEGYLYGAAAEIREMAIKQEDGK